MGGFESFDSNQTAVKVGSDLRLTVANKFASIVVRGHQIDTWLRFSESLLTPR